MATYTENAEQEEQEWDMEFKDPFSLEEEELPAFCTGILSQPAARSRTSYLSEGSLSVETLKGSVKKVTVTGERKRSGVELPNQKNSQHHSETETDKHSSTAASLDESSTLSHMSERTSSTSSDGMSHNTDAKLNHGKVSLTSSEEQSPIPVVLSSAKRFCASEDIEDNQAAKQDNAYFRLPPPSPVLHNSPARFAQPAYPPIVYNIPTWPTASVALPVKNSATSLQVHPMPVVPYNSCVPYAASLPHSSISALYDQSTTSPVEGTGSPNWSRTRFHLQTPPPVPSVNRPSLLGVPRNDFPAPVTHLLNGQTQHRFPLATVPQVIAPFPPSSINRLPFSTVLVPQQGQPLKAPSLQADSNSIVMSQVPSVRAQKSLPMPLSTNSSVSAGLSSSAVLKSSNMMLNDKATEQSRPTLPVTSYAPLGISNVCQSLTSSVLASKQIVTSATAVSGSDIPPPPPTRFNSRFAQLDPRINNGSRQNTVAASRSQPAVSTPSTASTAFVVPVPLPLPSLEELTAETHENLQKDDKAVVVSSISESTSSNTITTDSTKLDMVQTDRTQVVEEQVRTALKPFFKGGMIDKEAYKDIMRRAVPKICASRSADISTTRVQSFIDAYVAKVTNADKRKSGGSSSSTGSNTSRQDS